MIAPIISKRGPDGPPGGWSRVADAAENVAGDGGGGEAGEGAPRRPPCSAILKALGVGEQPRREADDVLGLQPEDPRAVWRVPPYDGDGAGGRGLVLAARPAGCCREEPASDCDTAGLRMYNQRSGS